MTSEVSEPPLVAPDEERPATATAAPALRRTDYGAFRGLVPGTRDLVLLRPRSNRLEIQSGDGSLRTLRWDDVFSVELVRTPRGPRGVPTACVRFASGEALDVADALAPGAAELPFSVEPGGPLILRVERFRLLTAAIVAAAGVEPTRLGRFERSKRLLPVPDLAIRQRILPPWAPPLLLIASVLVLEHFFAFDLWQAIGVTVVLLFHELGHVAAMKLGGTRVRGILFLPFAGAATLAEHAFVSRWHELWAQLAGPLMAFPTALAAIFLWRGGVVSESTGSVVFWAALFLNLLNLLPVLPLDGGRVLLSLTADFPRVARLPAVIVPIVLLVALFLLVSAGPGAFVAAIVLAFSLFATRMALRRDAFYRWMIDEHLPLGALRMGLRDVTWAFSGIAREDVDGGVPPTPMTGPQVAVGLLAYATTILAIVVVAAAAWVMVGPAWSNA